MSQFTAAAQQILENLADIYEPPEQSRGNLIAMAQVFAMLEVSEQLEKAVAALRGTNSAVSAISNTMHADRKRNGKAQ